MNPLLQSIHPTMAAALAPFMASAAHLAPRFPTTSCSQCHQNTGPGDHGFSHCQDHLPSLAELDEQRYLQVRRAELREEYDSGLDAVDLADDWEPEV